ncbi:hypothetical protein Leryth_001873 [Lithospermum erythrorhizon]|nr:hypothetical protein Leryth_001873 [Lithospermum erythrorhizon]
MVILRLNFPVVKRTKLPHFTSVSSIQDDMTRESLAKAKRFARFREELSIQSEDDHDTHNEKGASKRQQQAFTTETAIDVGGVSNSNISSDYENLESPGAIVGSCPDMCPESERSERERKGDLDHYERVDGDRNQTSRYLAVKKYTRTAEREAVLIRPMPILKKTMDYLLALLNQCYDGKFLALYNFLWDRMRAVRMDLRMQHIFNEGAISMLEQMIRLHIVAMHELCEYTKGEGFSEGFDAHLNIEQMNKTSVELFQLYDDHRKKGIEVPTEKEFRGYYALLKLDKHPGYKVEPAELSLDLAKMTPNMRQTSEVVFARKVARACRTGNFVAFFRLARRASYLQACLMHAHFAKLRTQALAALHNGLQNNQGIPVSHVSRWLGMEEEDTENLLEYHGFSIKEYEEPYMVKEAAFLNVDIDFPVKYSRLVHGKKSRSVFEDVSSPPFTRIYPHEVKKVQRSIQVLEQKQKSLGVSEATRAKDEEMPDYEIAVSTNKPVQMELMLMQTASKVKSPRHSSLSDGGAPFVEDSSLSQSTSTLPKEDSPFVHDLPMLKRTSSKLESPRHYPTLAEEGIPVAKGSPHSQSIFSPRKGNSPFVHDSPLGQPLFGFLEKGTASVHLSHQPSRLKSITKPKCDVPQNETLAIHKGETSDIANEEDEKGIITVTQFDSALEDPNAEHMSIGDLVCDQSRERMEVAKMKEAQESYYDEEVAEAKLRLILRLFKRRCSKLKELREQKQLAVSAAMNFLPLGPPMWQNRVESRNLHNFDIDNFMSKRHEIQERFCSSLNVSDVVAAKLKQKNSDAKCLCWKMVLCSEEDGTYSYTLGQTGGAHMEVSSWLRSKLMLDRCNDYDNVEGLVASSAGLSIWMTWLSSQSDSDITYCFSVVKETKSGNINETVACANSVLFVVSESISWDLQKNRLHRLVMSLPSDSLLPLLIVCGSCEENISQAMIAEGLQLNDVESRIRSFHISYLKNSQSKQFTGFFSDEQLREGLQWLASESPKQPDLQSIKTRDLVLSHLNPSFKGVDQLSPYRVGPDQCVSLFNGAVDQTIVEVSAAAEVNRIGWPCPELSLLERDRDEYRAIERYLPKMGWSTEANIASLVHLLNDCKLPPFRDDISWLYHGSELGHDIENQRSRLENLLVSYFTESCQMVGTSLAEKEASIMLQNWAGLHVHNSTFYIIPNWMMIFQRVFNWRLASLSRGEHSSAYILAHHNSNFTSRIIDITEVESGESHHMVRPTLDELVEVSCCLPVPETRYLQPPERSPPSPALYLHGRTPGIVNVVESTDTGEDAAQEPTSSRREDKDFSGQNSRGRDSVSIRASNEANRLSDLLHKCSIMQSRINEKLALYF